MQSIGVPTDIKPYAFIIVVILIGRLIQNFFTIPAKLYFDARRDFGKNNWANIEVTLKGIPNKKAFLGYGVQIRNDMALELSSVIFQIPYFDIDDVRYEHTEWSGFTQQPGSHIRRLSWLNNDNSRQATEKYIDSNGGSASTYLFDVVAKDNAQKNFYLRYSQKSETTGQFEECTKQIKTRVSGLLILHIMTPLGEQIYGNIANRYYFEIFIDENCEITTKFDEQPISTYKPPNLEII